jgi:pyrroline-5-carboxylate reductase
MDSVTAVYGSGSAYVFYLVEAMIEAGIKQGLSPDLSHILVTKTLSGAGQYLAQSDDSPAQLRKNVTSPNGTTQAALEVLMGQGGFMELLDKAIERARLRSEELAK